MIQYNTIQYNTIQYNTIQYNTIQYNTTQYNTVQYNTIPYNTMIAKYVAMQIAFIMHVHANQPQLYPSEAYAHHHIRLFGRNNGSSCKEQTADGNSGGIDHK